MREALIALEVDRLLHLRIAAAGGNSALACVVKTLWNQRMGPLFLRLEHHFDTPQLWDAASGDRAARRLSKSWEKRKRK